MYDAKEALKEKDIIAEDIENALKNPKDKDSERIINSAIDVMKKNCGITLFSKSNIEDFVNILKSCEFKQILLDAKFLGFKGMLFNLKAKEIISQQLDENTQEKELEVLKPEVLFGYVTEKKNINKSKIDGDDTVRIVIKGKDDRGSMQFHIQKNKVLNALKEYDMEIEENEKLEDAVSICIPSTNIKAKRYIRKYRGDLGWNTIDNFENFDGNTFMEITKKMIKKLSLITRLNKEKKGEELKYYDGYK